MERPIAYALETSSGPLHDPEQLSEIAHRLYMPKSRFCRNESRTFRSSLATPAPCCAAWAALLARFAIGRAVASGVGLHDAVPCRAVPCASLLCTTQRGDGLRRKANAQRSTGCYRTGSHATPSPMKSRTALSQVPPVQMPTASALQSARPSGLAWSALPKSPFRSDWIQALPLPLPLPLSLPRSHRPSAAACSSDWRSQLPAVRCSSVAYDGCRVSLLQMHLRARAQRNKRLRACCGSAVQCSALKDRSLNGLVSHTQYTASRTHAERMESHCNQRRALACFH